MTITNPPGWLQNAGNTHTAAQLRMYMASLQAGSLASSSLRARGGVHPSHGLKLIVTQTGSPSMAVLVESGMASIPGTESNTQGNYFAVNDAQVTLSVSAAHATLPRIDIVVINIRDQFYSGASNDSQLQVIAGTPASSPVAPTAPANSITLAQIAVAAAATSITNANITDTRFYLASTGGVINARTDATRPASGEISEGQFVWANDNNRLYIWDGSLYNQLFPVGFIKLSENVLGSPASSVTFSSISSSYRVLKLYIAARGSNASSFSTATMRFNSDTAANYDTESVVGFGTTASAVEGLAGTSIGIGELGAASSSAGNGAIYEITIPWYASTTIHKYATINTSLSFGTATTQIQSKQFTGRWRNTAAITSIQILIDAGNFIAGSSFALYGML